jgi:hypothetical protein
MDKLAERHAPMCDVDDFNEVVSGIPGLVEALGNIESNLRSLAEDADAGDVEDVATAAYKLGARLHWICDVLLDGLDQALNGQKAVTKLVWQPAPPGSLGNRVAAHLAIIDGDPDRYYLIAAQDGSLDLPESEHLFSLTWADTEYIAQNIPRDEAERRAAQHHARRG